jgi:ribosomal protein S18 acetylase RimI-like enzyme
VSVSAYPFRAATPGDLDALAALYADADPVDFGQVLWKSADIEDTWHRARFDMTRDTWVADAPDGSVASYGFVWAREPSSYVIAAGTVHPDHRGRGIGGRLADAMEQRAREMVSDAPAGVTPMLNSAVPAEDPAAIRLLEGRGYVEARRFWQMERKLNGRIATPRDPEGLKIGRASDADAPTLHGVIQDAFQDHWRPRREPFEEWEARNLKRSNNRFWFLATGGDEPAGALTSFVEGDRGHVDQIGVRKEWRRRGVGEALLLHSFAALVEAGATSVELEVDSENPTGATGLYERVGMHAVLSYVFFDKPL